MASPSDSLKKELLQAQNERGKLMKWKILLISGIGSAALGFSASPALPYAELALCVIPFACAYVDLLCRNLSVRTKLISAFMAKQPDDHENPSPRFEKFIRNLTKNAAMRWRGSRLSTQHGR
jgi:hypothetical protein